MSKIIDATRQYKVRGDLMTLIRELRLAYIALDRTFNNIFNNPKDDNLIKISELQREHRDFLIGKIIYCFWDEGCWGMCDNDIDIPKAEDLLFDNDKYYIVSGRYLYCLNFLEDKKPNDNDIAIGQLVSEFEKNEWGEV